MSVARARLGVAQLSFWFPHANGFCQKSNTRGDVDLKAVWDDDPQRGAERAAFFGVGFEPDLDKLLARSDVQAVSICAEPFRQPELVEAAAAAGKDIVIEKAMAGSLEGAGRIVRAVQRHGVRLLPTFNLRWHPAGLRVRELLYEGAVGRVSRVRRLHGHYGYAEQADFDYRNLQHQLGWGDPVAEQVGSLYYVATHATLWLVWLFGVPEAALAMGTTTMTSMPVEDSAVTLFRYPPADGPFRDGFIATMESSETMAASPVVAEIYGTDGTLVQHRGSLPSTRVWNPSPTPVSVFRRSTEEWHYPATPPHFVRHEHRYSGFDIFLDCVLAGEPTPMNEVDGYHSIAMVVAAERSIQSRQEVAVSSWPTSPGEERSS